MSAPEPTVPRPLTILLLGFVAPLAVLVSAFALSDGLLYTGLLLGLVAVVVVVQWLIHSRVDAVLAELQHDDSVAPSAD